MNTTSATLDTPRLGDFVLGLHLRHLRECQGLARADISHRMPDHIPVTADGLAAIENGQSPQLRHAAERGRHHHYLTAYGAGHEASLDYLRRAQQITASPPDGFVDDGLGWLHRYQIAEQNADTLLLAGDRTIPTPLRTPDYTAALAMEALAPTLAAPAPPGVGCPACPAYRSGRLANPATSTAWHRALHTARSEAFAARLHRPGPPTTTVLLAEGLLRRHVGGARTHARQMLHLDELARESGLQVRIVPAGSGVLLREGQARLRFGPRALTTRLLNEYATYREGASNLDAALECALDPETSLRMVVNAAAGTLPRRPGRGECRP
ncbi:Scr1 family TA system antitoxin-like transcriptional regulator [Kitasatospora sp. NPDC127111]|uniref:Scr1 family TA system antitoxin-like transcriptional regulator n=1 Tax=Kitasatospora sp. NPDC127111 TaxID=3345363 RepID=UPI00363C2FE1